MLHYRSNDDESSEESGCPLQGEKDCAYYVQTGSCKYGSTCRFHHPQPTTAESVLQSPNSSLYLPSGVTTPASVPYQDGVTTWPVARAPYIPPATGIPRPANFMPLLVSSPQPIPMTDSTPFKVSSSFSSNGSFTKIPSWFSVHTANPIKFY